MRSEDNSGDKSGVAIGIDLGVDCCRSAVAMRDGKVATLVEKFPSAVYIESSNERWKVGWAHHNVNPANYINDACLDHSATAASCLQVPQWAVKIDSGGHYHTGSGVVVSQQEVIAALLARLKELAEGKLSLSVNRAVIAIPSFSSDNYRRVVLQAAELAGFTHARLLNQSTAAAIAFRKRHSDETSNYQYLAGNFTTRHEHAVIVNMGAKSFEVAVYRVAPDSSMQLVEAQGSCALGGRDVTDEITSQLLAANHCTTYSPSYLMGVWQECESGKRQLSEIDSIQLAIKSPTGDETLLPFTLARSQLLTLDIHQSIRCKVEQVLSRLSASDQATINEVLFVGGSSLLPMIRGLLRELLPHARRVTTINVFEAVSTGAAVAAALSYPTSFFANRLLSYAHVNECAFRSFTFHVLRNGGTTGAQSLAKGRLVARDRVLPVQGKLDAVLQVFQHGMCVELYEDRRLVVALKAKCDHAAYVYVVLDESGRFDFGVSHQSHWGACYLLAEHMGNLLSAEQMALAARRLAQQQKKRSQGGNEEPFPVKGNEKGDSQASAMEIASVQSSTPPIICAIKETETVLPAEMAIASVAALPEIVGTSSFNSQPSTSVEQGVEVRCEDDGDHSDLIKFIDEHMNLDSSTHL